MKHAAHGLGKVLRMRMISFFLFSTLISFLFLSGAFAGNDVFESRSLSNFSKLIDLLNKENERPTPNLPARIEKVLSDIQEYSAADYAIAQAIMDSWRNVAMNESYPMMFYQGGETADELADSGIVNSRSHAFIVMGYELSGGRMRDELLLRCNAAAAAARSYPDAFIIGTGGDTGPNNRNHRTEAQAIKDYLTQNCGIDSSRVLVEGTSRNTAGNAVNVFRLLKKNEIHTITIITSSYHQRWSQLLFSPMAELYRQFENYDVEVVSNFNVVGEIGLKPQYERKSGLSQLRQIFGKYNESRKYASD